VVDQIEQGLPGWRYSANWYQGRITGRIRANVEAEKQAKTQRGWDKLNRGLFGPIHTDAQKPSKRCVRAESTSTSLSSVPR